MRPWRCHLVTHIRLIGRLTQLKQKVARLRDLVTHGHQNRLYCQYFRWVAGLRDLVTHGVCFSVFAASIRGGPFASAGPVVHCQARGSNPGSRVSEATVSDLRPYWPCGIQVLNSIFADLYFVDRGQIRYGNDGIFYV